MVSVPGVSQEHSGLSLSECENLGYNKSSQMWDGKARAIVLSTHSAAFHPSPGKEKKPSCKFCSPAAMVSTRGCGPHCSASPGRSLALRGAWHALPWLAPCSLLWGLGAQACFMQPGFPQRCRGGLNSRIDQFYVSFAVNFLFTSLSRLYEAVCCRTVL